MDYLEIAKRLRNYEWERDDDGKCLGCPDEESYYPCCVDCFSRTHLQAANAIEELQAKYNELLFRCGQAEALIDFYQQMPKEDEA